MRYRVVNIPLWLDEDEALLAERAAQKLGVGRGALRDVAVLRRSLDARKKGHPRWLVNLEVAIDGEVAGTRADVSPAPLPEPEPGPVRAPELPPVILGAGPAGLFCAHALLGRGVRSVVVDRGKRVEPRRLDVTRLMRSGDLDPESNMSFGEGGAGAYTDGKLGTRIHHPAVRRVVELFAHYGGVNRILSEGKPHVGSDLLPAAVSAMRADLEAGGCEFHWNARAMDLELREGRVRGLVLADGRTLPCDRLVLAPGNSARELFELFAARGWPIEAKPFAVGFRAEHPQALIDQIQYGPAAGRPGLPPADYKLADNPRVEGQARGVFSFCMCPGGVVVPTPTEPGLQCTNGMSNSRRSSRLANAGLVAAVGPPDFEAEGFRGPLAGLAWQRKWEARAYELAGGGYRAPAQRLTDYLAGRSGQPPGASSYPPGLVHADLATLYPPAVRAALRDGLRAFERRMHGYVTDEAVLIGVESRTSSPCRLVRGDDHQSPGLRGLYPAGEGAGYAGGIVSSAVDGLRAAEAICAELGPA
ncbi:MAG TPA: FAD-dependent oxidoreductase [Anaeromyxobacteraceae bacterium]